MGGAAQRQRGFGLIEVMVTVVIAALLIALAMPSFSSWMQNTRIRVTAESLLAGLQYAKSEATTRNARVRFQLTTTADNQCALSTSGASWVVDMVDDVAADDSVEGQCGGTPSDTAAPRILQTRTAGDGSGTTVVQGDVHSLVFNGLGRLTPAPNSPVTINIGNTGSGGCAEEGGALTCLRVVISPAGQVRMCNPRFASGDQQAC